MEKSNALHLQHNSHIGTNYYPKCSFCVNQISDRCNCFLILHETQIFDCLHHGILVLRTLEIDGGQLT